MKKTLIVALGLAGLIAGNAQAYTLDFTGSNICSSTANGLGTATACADYGYIAQSYGDDAGLVDVTYTDLVNSRSLSWWNANYNNLTDVLWGGNGDATGLSLNQIKIEALNGQAVMLTGFDMGAYNQTQRTTNLRILNGDGSSVLSSQSGVAIGTGNIATAFSLNLTSANGFIIEWGDTGYNVGIDNIVFDLVDNLNPPSTVPEPGSLALLGASMLGMMLARRRK